MSTGHSKPRLGAALGCLAYDSLMLLAALQVFQARHTFPHFEGLNWGWPQIAIEVILAKSRSLMDFFSPTGDPRDIAITDFGHPAIVLPPELVKFRGSVNQWCVHLAWQRVDQLATRAPQPLREDMQRHARWLLSESVAFVRDHISEVTLEHARHQYFCDALQREHAKLVALPRAQCG